MEGEESANLDAASILKIDLLPRNRPTAFAVSRYFVGPLSRPDESRTVGVVGHPVWGGNPAAGQASDQLLFLKPCIVLHLREAPCGIKLVHL